MSLEVAVRLSKRWAGACGGCAARCGRAGVPVEVREPLRRVTYPTERTAADEAFVIDTQLRNRTRCKKLFRDFYRKSRKHPPSEVDESIDTPVARSLARRTPVPARSPRVPTVQHTRRLANVPQSPRHRRPPPHRRRHPCHVRWSQRPPAKKSCRRPRWKSARHRHANYPYPPGQRPPRLSPAPLPFQS